MSKCSCLNVGFRCCLVVFWPPSVYNRSLRLPSSFSPSIPTIASPQLLEAPTILSEIGIWPHPIGSFTVDGFTHQNYTDLWTFPITSNNFLNIFNEKFSFSPNIPGICFRLPNTPNASPDSSSLNPLSRFSVRFSSPKEILQKRFSRRDSLHLKFQSPFCPYRTPREFRPAGRTLFTPLTVVINFYYFLSLWLITPTLWLLCCYPPPFYVAPRCKLVCLALCFRVRTRWSSLWNFGGLLAKRPPNSRQILPESGHQNHLSN